MSQVTIDAGTAVRYGWESVKKNLWYFVAIAFVSGVISSIGSDPKQTNSWDLIGFLASVWMTCGTTMIYLRFHRGEKPDLSTLFTAIEPYFKVLGATVIYGFIVTAGLILLIVPGIIWAIKYQFMATLIIDQKLGIQEAMERSAAMTKGRKMSLFGFDLTMLGVVVLGALALGVGLLVAIPVAGLAMIDLYTKLKAEPAPAPRTA